jgi:hypothetical protein
MFLLTLSIAPYEFIELHDNPVRVEGKRTAHSPGGCLEEYVRWDDERYPFALKLCVDDIQVLDPETDMRDADLSGLNTRARRERVLGSD